MVSNWIWYARGWAIGYGIPRWIWYAIGAAILVILCSIR